MRKKIILSLIVLFLVSCTISYYAITYDKSSDLEVDISSPENNFTVTGSSSFRLSSTIRCQSDNCGNISVYPEVEKVKPDERIKVGIFGDLQTSNPEYLPSYSKTVQLSRNGYPETDFALSVGDVVADRTGNYPTENAVSNATELVYDYQTTPFFQVIGNHDMSDWKDRPEKPWLGEKSLKNESGLSGNTYGFEYNNALFLVLGDEGGEARLKKQQLAWIDSMMERNPEKPTFVFMHPEPTEHDSCGEQNRDYMHHLNQREDHSWYSMDFISRDNVKMVVHGHCENLPDNSFNGYYKVVNDTVTVGVPSFRDFFGVTEDNGYLEITQSEIKMRVWDEQNNSFVSTRTHSSDLNLTDEGFESYYLPHFFQDGEVWNFNNRIATKDAELNLIGTNYTGKGYNNHFNKFVPSGGCAIGFPGYQGDVEENSEAGKAIFSGKSELRHIDSDEGCGNDGPHHVMPRAVPDGEYNISVEIKGDSYEADVFDIKVNYIAFDDGLESPVASDTIASDIDIKSDYQRKSYEFTVPNKSNIDVMQIIWSTNGSNTYYMDNYRLARNGSGETENFSVEFNGHTISSTQRSLSNGVASVIDINSTLVRPQNTVSASIDGNKNGIVELKYTRPIAQSLSGAIGVKSVNNNIVDVEINRIGKYSDRVKLLPMTSIEDTNLSLETSYQNDYYYLNNPSSSMVTRQLTISSNDSLGNNCDNSSIEHFCTSQSSVQYGNLSRGDIVNVSWDLHPKEYGEYNISVSANSSGIGQKVSSKDSVGVSVAD